MAIGRARVVLLIGAVLVAGYMSLDQIGAAVLHRGVPGPMCPVPMSVTGVSFDVDAQELTGAQIHVQAGDPMPACTRIGTAFKCTQSGPSLIAVQLDGVENFYRLNEAREDGANAVLIRRPETQSYYAVPDDALATFYGDEKGVACVLTYPEVPR